MKISTPYTFYYDPTLTEMVRKKIEEGNRSGVYKIADARVILNQKYTKGINLAYEASLKTGSNFPVIWSVDISQLSKIPKLHLLFFINSPTPILDKLSSLKPKKHVDTPKSVLIKMARSRIMKLRRYITVQNTNNADGKSIKFIEIGDLDTIVAIDKACADLCASHTHYAHFKPDCVRAYQEDLKNKALFDDSVVHEAWKYILIDDIHKL